MRTLPVFLALFACKPAVIDSDDTDPQDTDTDVVVRPPCESGSTFVSWTRDGGVTIAPVTEGPQINNYTWSIAIAEDAPDVLVAEHAGQLWRSTDAGCTFTTLGALSTTIWDLHAVGGGEVWGHVENGPTVVHLSSEDGIKESAGPGDGLVGMTIDRGDVFVGTTAGTRYQRYDEGWLALSGPPDGSTAYDWAFDPRDPNRVVAGLVRDGVWWTHDGVTWQHAAGIPEPANVFTVAWSPADPDVVWAEGLDLDEMDAGDPSGGRHGYRSSDGGQSFLAVVDNSVDVTLTNGLPLTPDPVDPDVVWFEFGSSFQGEGTWVYRYDHATRAVTKAHQDWDEFRALTFSPADPALMYFSLIDEQISAR
jgi:hypothetical protein